jgi:formate-dependent nitrite reductase membrane component NrfD
MELHIVGTNAITYPAMHVWDWRVASYLFLGGLSGGLMTMSAVNYIRPGRKQSADAVNAWKIPALIPILLTIGLIFLNLDLERPFNAFWFYLAFKPVSPMSWGAWIVFIIYPLLIAYALAALPDEIRTKIKYPSIRQAAENLKPHLSKLAKANVIAGVLLAIYTGVLLSSLVARPLWSTPILPVLFLVSGMSTGAALMIILAKSKETKLFFTKIDVWLIIAELTILLLMFYGHYVGDAAHQQAITPFFSTSHEFFPYFFSIVVLGTCLPLAVILKFLEVTGEHTEELSTSSLMMMNFSAVLVLVGGAVIRFALVYAGQLSGYSAYM